MDDRAVPRGAEGAVDSRGDGSLAEQMQFIRQVLDRVGDKWSLLARAAYVEAPPRVEYSLTPLGRGLHEIVTSLNGWAAEHHNETCENRARATTN